MPIIAPKERSLFANSAWGVMFQAIRGAMGLIFVPVVIARIGLNGYGIYSIILLLSFYQGLLGQLDLGYPAFLINFLSRNLEELHQTPVMSRVRGLLSFLLFSNTVISIVCLSLPLMIT